MQAVALVVDIKPGAHTLHDDRDEAGLNKPALHAVHAVAAGAELIEPARHERQAVVLRRLV